jgi:hypothetical protein
MTFFAILSNPLSIDKVAIAEISLPNILPIQLDRLNLDLSILPTRPNLNPLLISKGIARRQNSSVVTHNIKYDLPLFSLF